MIINALGADRGSCHKANAEVTWAMMANHEVVRYGAVPGA
jgi:hypothetical protein